MSLRLTYFVSHPIQYQAPLLRRIAADADLSLLVVFESDFSERRYRDAGFGVDVSWDVPLREGYESRVMDEVEIAKVIVGSDAVWVHGWQSPKLRRVIATASAAGRPVLMRGENWAGAMPDGLPPRRWIKQLYLSRIFSHCRAFLAIGSKNRDYYRQHGVPAVRIFDMPYAVDNDFFAARATPDAAADVRRRHGIAPDRKVILYAGKLTRRKHADDVLAAWRGAAWDDGQRPVLLFVGDGELRCALEGESESDVVFAGFRNQSEMPGYYAVADLFVLMAEREPWGLAINEAMACGTAVVASDEVGAAYDLVDESTGLRLAAGDVAGLARALPELLRRSDTLAIAARARIAHWDFEADLNGLKSALSTVA